MSESSKDDDKPIKLWHVVLGVLVAGSHIYSIVHSVLHGIEGMWFWMFISISVIFMIASGIYIYSNINRFKRLSAQLGERTTELAAAKSELEKTLRYKHAYSKLNDAYRDIHLALWKDPSSCPAALGDFCTKLADIFSEITGKPCHCAIKMVKEDASKKVEGIMTIARDAVSASNRKNGRQKVTDHLISDNTDFSHIVKQLLDGKPAKEATFISNDLLKFPYYANSSFRCFTGGNPRMFKPHEKMEFKRENWKLEYKSTIIAPIHPETNNIHSLAFLCVHCDHTDVFENADVVILCGCADGLINIITKSVGMPEIA